MHKYPRLTSTFNVDVMLLGEDRHSNTRGVGCCSGVPVGLHMSSEDQSDARARHPVNGGFVMDVARKLRRDSHWTSTEPLPTRLQTIRCTVPSCTCECFSPGKMQIRTCETCKHGWVTHALDKLGFRHLYNCNQVEIVQPNIVFDIASLMLYGCQATPIRLKILLDRLFSVLQHEEVLQVLHGFGWRYEDYARGYILQDSQGNVLDRWTVATREEEPLILQQFLRFGETKAITQQILLQESNERSDCIIHPPRTDSDIKKFIERTNRAIINAMRPGESYLLGKGATTQPSSQPASQIPPLLTTTTTAASSSSSSSSSTNTINNKGPLRLPSVTASGGGITTSGVSVTSSTPAPPAHNLSPNGSSQHSFGSPVNCTSPLSISPLNRLQSMQPYDFRRERVSPDARLPHGSDLLPTSTLSQSSLAVTSPTTTMPSLTPHPISTSALALVNSTNSSLLANSDLSATDCGSEDDTSNMALNLSRSGSVSTALDSVYATKKVKHLRKSANPMKRRWNPGIMSTMISNTGSGKKRVQCNVCLKTFCDKGALKIHFSAVHLREMHKCTVEGCNMMFSSRRSRNRHSANPNPKLHTPHLRRKISPHDGRTANPNPLLLAGGLMSGLAGPLGLSDVMNPLNAMSGLSLSRTDSPEKHFDLSNSTNPMTPNPGTTASSPERPTMVRSPLGRDGIYYMNPHDEAMAAVASSMTKRPRLSDGDEGEDASNEEEEEMPKNLSAKDDTKSATKGVRKRKSLNPTRVATRIDVEDIQYVSTDVDDESSSDTYLHGDSLENGTEKSDDFKDDDKDLDDDKSSDSQGIEIKEEIKNSVTPLIPVDRIKRERHDPGGGGGGGRDCGGGEGGGIDAENDPNSNPAEQVSSSSYDESSENALKHLESLSQGNFGDLLHNNARSLVGQTTLLPNSLGLPLVGMGLPGGGFRDLSPKLGDGAGMAAAAIGPHPGGGSSPSSPLSESQPLPGLPPFRDASIVGNVDIPVDKDNPRRCIACGKIFQNHFGVKTHYQNVHLKLMHKCTVEGCNAAFPSKRSRDRHSANLNLHRKLLSTSDKAFLDKGSPFSAALAGQTLRDEFLARIYGEPPVLPLGLDPYQTKLPVSLAETILNNNHERVLHANHLSALAPHLNSGLIPGLLLPPHALCGTGTMLEREMASMETPVSSATPSPHNPHTPTPSTPTPNSASQPSLVYSLEDDVPSPDADGSLLCKFCQKKFSDGLLLKEHYEKLHIPEMFRCTVDGCNKIFTSQKKRNAHSQNDSAHKHLAASETSS